MRMFVIALRDEAAASFGRPQFFGSKGLALRAFQDEVNRDDKENAVFQHPQDFSLYLLAYYDDSLGLFEPLQMPERLALASDFKK